MRQTRTQTTTQKMTRILAATAMLVLSLATPRLAAEPCEPGWAEGEFCEWDLDGTVYSAVTWDDGTGEALYIGGLFVTEGCRTDIADIAKMKGPHWRSLTGADGTTIRGPVDALAVYDDGTGPALYAGGWLGSNGGVDLKNIAKWDGVNWTPLTGPSGTGLNGKVEAMAVFDDGSGPALHVGGSFTTAGGVPAWRIAKWDGMEWSALAVPGGNGVNDRVRALAVYDDGSGPALYAGGDFTLAGGVFANRIAKWDGAAWSALSGPNGNGMDGDVQALAVFDDGSGSVLVAGGSFKSAGGVPRYRVAKWNGVAWSRIGADSVNEPVRALAVFNDGSGSTLYAGGAFGTSGMLMLVGEHWLPPRSPNGIGLNGEAEVMVVFGDESEPGLYVGGGFSSAGGESTNGIAKWDGTAWYGVSVRSGNGLVGPTGPSSVLALRQFDDGSGPTMFVGGNFVSGDGVTLNNIAKWDGLGWSALSGPGDVGVNAWVYDLAVFDDGTGPGIYVGGNLTTAGGIAARHIAKWDGITWSALIGSGGNGLNGAVLAQEVFDDGTGPALFMGGVFTVAGGATARRIVKWDGKEWTPLVVQDSNGLGDSVLALAVFDDGTGPALFLGGDFVRAAGVWVNYIVKWDGSDWSRLSGPNFTGMNGRVKTLAVFDDGSGPTLYAGGDFTRAGGLTVNYIAKWDGTTWSVVSGLDGVGIDTPIETLEVLDDGTGPALYATRFGLSPVVRWDGARWTALVSPDGASLEGGAQALEVIREKSATALYVGGDFSDATGFTAEPIAKWTACLPDPSCNPADIAEPFDTLDLTDITSFVTAFGNMAPDADLAEPVGLFDLADLLAFVTAFGAGCP